MRLSDALAGYWLEKQLDLSLHTARDYSLTFSRMSDFLGDPDFASITADDIRRFLAHCQKTFGLGHKTVTNHWIALSSLWAWAEREHNLPHIIRGRIKRKRIESEPVNPFEASEIALLLEGVRFMAAYTGLDGTTHRARRPTATRDTAILLTLLDSGLRASELCDLCVRDYDKLRGQIHVKRGKGGKSRYVPLGSRSQQAIQEYMSSRPKAKTSEPLFPTRTGGHMDRNSLGNLLERIGANAGVANVFPHRFRHTFAIGFLRAGGNALLLQKLLGHSSLDMTRRYVAFVEQDITSAGRFSPADRMLQT
jgi:site-specific recombinase XerD